MASITKPLPNTSFSDNIPDLEISGVTDTAYLSVKMPGGIDIRDVALTPNAQKRITIYTRQFTRQIQALAEIRDVVTKRLPTIDITLTIGDQALTQSCLLIPGAIERIPVDMDEFLSRNFLTWQPQIIETTPSQPQWIAWALTSLASKYELKSTLYSSDGRSFSKTLYTLDSISLVYYRQYAVDFAHLWKSKCDEQNITPICYDVYGVADIQEGTERLQTGPLVCRQRYMLRQPRLNDICIGFINTLGGFDTLMLEGKQLYLPEGDVSSFKTQNGEIEFDNAYTSTWEANTGYIETERQAGQFQDFLKSTNRYIFKNGEWKQICVTEYKIKHTRGELNAYTFKYHLSNQLEGRYYERIDLPEVELPTNFYVNGKI